MNKLRITRWALPVAACILSGCTSPQPDKRAEASVKPAVSANAAASTSPRQDFYAWANRDWLAATDIPPDKPGINNFVVIQQRVTTDITRMLGELGQQADLPPSQRQLSDLYGAFVDMARRDAAGMAPLKAELAQVDAARSHADVVALFAKWQMLGVDSPLVYAVAADMAQSNRNIVYVAQAGLGLEREDYLGTDERTRVIRQQYQALLQKMFELAGEPGAAEQAGAVMALESGLAGIQWTKSDSRDIKKSYNVTDFKGLVARTGRMDVSRQLAELGLPTGYPFNVIQPTYVDALNSFLPAQAMSAWRSYLKSRLLMNYAGLLDSSFKAALSNYEIQRGLSAREEPLAQQAVNYLNSNAGMLLGKTYVERHFDEGVKVQLKQLIQSIVAEYSLAIQTSPRMTAQTKAAALDKLGKITFKIGYPDKWRDYSGLVVKPGELVENHKRLQRFETRHNLGKLGQPIDKDDWGYPPQVVNAFYEPSSNSFVLLAAILHEPFYTAGGTDAELYGGMGFVIGHEIGHGFDDQGSQFDGQGNLKNWWAPEDSAAYNKIRDSLIAQANAYEILPGRFLKGELEIGEILGDVSGAEIALRAYKKVARAKGVDEQTAYRAFFTQLAKTWRSKMRDEFALMLLDKDVHPPSEFRANGIVKNFDEFHQAFQTRPGDAMYMPPTQRVTMWP